MHISADSRPPCPLFPRPAPSALCAFTQPHALSSDELQQCAAQAALAQPIDLMFRSQPLHSFIFKQEMVQFCYSEYRILIHNVVFNVWSASAQKEKKEAIKSLMLEKDKITWQNFWNKKPTNIFMYLSVSIGRGKICFHSYKNIYCMMQKSINTLSRYSNIYKYLQWNNCVLLTQ